jgi:hypothetical protein
VTEREREEGDTFLMPVEYVIGFFYKRHLFKLYLNSVFGITTNMNIHFKNLEIYDQHYF